ncbi:MAG: DUF1376 domain-containing protein, partial [candidate division Zixibacteria bacterium]|nr:DUF1376 domain-containing protein [candidate division Zixibacteria bacterium]
MALPYMPLYVGDFIRDTRNLSTEQVGAYMLLLMAQWQTGKLPDDPVQLARIAGVEAERWGEVSRLIMGYFRRVKGGALVQKRLTRERERILKTNRARKASGKLGGKAKSLVSKGETPLANAKQMLKQTGSGYIEDSPLLNENPNGKESFNASEFDELWSIWPLKENR